MAHKGHLGEHQLGGHPADHSGEPHHSKAHVKSHNPGNPHAGHSAGHPGKHIGHTNPVKMQKMTNPPGWILGHHDAKSGKKMGHTTVGHMEHIPYSEAFAQGNPHFGTHGEHGGVHPAAGVTAGLHTFHNVRHPGHESKLSEG